MTKTVDRDQLRRRIDAGTPPILVEALPERYFAEGHLPGALHMPHDAVKERAPALLPDKEADIVVYCASDSCRNSHVAAATLEMLGYRKVAVYPGGKKEWQEAGLPLER